jgi:hypothetical protein
MKIFILLAALFFTLVGCGDNPVANETTAKVEANSEPSTSKLDSEVFKVKGEVIVAGLCGTNLNLPGGKTPNCSNGNGVEVKVVVLSKSGEKVMEMQPDTNNFVAFTLPVGEYTILVPETFITEKKELALNVTGEQNITIHLQSKLLVR